MTRALLVAFFLLVAFGGSSRAATTTTVAVTTAWQDLGVGPLQIQTNNQSQVVYAIADSTPAPNAAGFQLQGLNVPQTINTTSHVYVRILNSQQFGRPVVATVTYAPVTAVSVPANTGGTFTATPASSSGAYSGATVTGTPAQVLPAVTARAFLDLKNESTFPVACSLGGTPSLNTAGSFTLAPGYDKTWEGSYVPSDQVTCVTSAGNSAPLTIGAK